MKIVGGLCAEFSPAKFLLVGLLDRGLEMTRTRPYCLPEPEAKLVLAYDDSSGYIMSNLLFSSNNIEAYLQVS